MGKHLDIRHLDRISKGQIQPQEHRLAVQGRLQGFCGFQEGRRDLDVRPGLLLGIAWVHCN